MPNADYSRQDITNALRQLGIGKGDTIFIHSNLGFFGRLEGAKDADALYSLFKQAIFEVLGNEGTLVVPTFSYSFCKKQEFDVTKTPGVCGLFSEMVRKDPESLRSEDANFSVAALGKRASELTAAAPAHSFGPNSFWERFLNAGGKFCNLNFDAGSTFVHYVEKTLAVPYRYDKPFQGVFVSKGERRPAIQWHFVYDLGKPGHEADFTKFDAKAKELGLAKTAKLGKGSVLCISAKDTFSLIQKELQSDPAFLVKSGKLDLSPTNSEKGDRMLLMMAELYPICRSITGNGVRETLKIIQKHIPLQIREVPTGTQVFDWAVPKEWNARDAYIVGPDGKRFAEFRKSNLHLLNYSIPIKAKMKLSELKSHLFSLPAQPDAIPYLTSYYKEDWGFCIADRELQRLQDGIYEVFIDSELKAGSLTYGELVVKGKSQEEMVFSSYVCHPSICNDNLSGPVLLAFLAQRLIALGGKHQYTYRFLFIPETIGAITWLAQNEGKLANIKHGLVATCCGDGGRFTYKKSRKGDAAIDGIAICALALSGEDFEVVEFFPSGSDERQFSSLAFDLPFGSLMRTMYAKYPEYHTSQDDLSFISASKFAASLELYWKVILLLEGGETDGKERYLNTNPKCEPQLGRRGLYRLIGGQKGTAVDELSIFWVLNLSDGTNSLLDISVRARLPLAKIKAAADALLACGLLK